ncbi:MAG: glutaredoxin family protein [Anaerolineae bacterium]
MRYNSGMQTVTLYTKLDCSLCDKAYKILLSVAFEIPLEIDVVDITHAHNNLEANYGTRIPVVALANGDELNWPFSAQDVKSRLAAL